MDRLDDLDGRATILAGHVIEALLLWALKNKGGAIPFKKSPDNLHLHDLIAEAEKRGLPNYKSTTDSVPSLISKEAVELFDLRGCQDHLASSFVE